MKLLQTDVKLSQCGQINEVEKRALTHERPNTRSISMKFKLIGAINKTTDLFLQYTKASLYILYSSRCNNLGIAGNRSNDLVIWKKNLDNRMKSL